MSRKKGFSFGLIQDDPVSEAIDIVALIALVFLLISAVVYVNLYIAALALTSLAMIWTASRIGYDASLLKQARNEKTPRGVGSFTLWIAICLGGFLFLDLVVPPAFGLLNPSSVYLSSIPAGSVLSVSALVAVLNADAEEDFFRQAMTNLLVVRLRAGYLGLVGSAIIFAAAHLFVDSAAGAGTNFVDITIIFGAGFLFGFGDLVTRRLGTSKVSHIINNLGALGILSVINQFGGVHVPTGLFFLVALL